MKTGTARPTDQVVVDVNSRNGGTLVEKRFEPPTSLPADVYFDLDLARTEEIAEVRVWISCDSSSTLAVTVQSVYLVR